MAKNQKCGNGGTNMAATVKNIELFALPHIWNWFPYGALTLWKVSYLYSILPDSVVFVHISLGLEVSRPRDSYAHFSNRSEIWQAHRQRCRDACQISERHDHYNTQYHDFESSRDLAQDVRPRSELRPRSTKKLGVWVRSQGADFIETRSPFVAVIPQCIVPWWRHQMETVSALLAICAGNSPVPGEFTAQRPVTRSFDVFFDLRLDKQLSKQTWGWRFETLSRPLWRHCNAIILKYLYLNKSLTLN